MKRLELIFNIASIFVDSLMLLIAGLAAYFLRYKADFPQYPIMFDLAYKDMLRNILIAIPFLIIILALYGLYNVRITQGIWRIFVRTSAGISTGLMVFVAIYFFNPQIFPSRLIALMSWLAAIVLVSLGRTVLVIVQRAFLKMGIGLHKLVIIVNPDLDFNLPREISSKPELGYRLIETLDGQGPILQELEALRTTQGIDELVVANFGLSRQTNDSLVRYTHDWGIKFNYVPDIIEAQRTNIEVGDICGIPVIELKNTPLEGWGRVVKRTVDIILSVVGIIIASPLLLLVAIIIRLDSSGKILFVQERFGQGRPFKFFKFRSMYQELSIGDGYGGEEAERVRSELKKTNARLGPFVKIKNDPRVTSFGRFIRRTKLDELPQLFNVLKGDMSLVGPRAHVLDEVEAYRQTYKRQFTIKPGITGITQVTQAKIPDLPFEEEIRLDTFYLENWSLKLDMSLLLQTVFVLLRRSKKDQDY